MTREFLPQFDLYGELEVSPDASVGAIEAAYRSLVKQHHPDVSPSAGGERIKRLNLAREWLTDPDRRRRYDAIRRPQASRHRPTPRGRTTPPPPSRGAAGAAAPDQSFGPNADAVRQFLVELRGLDRYRARQVWDGHAVAHAKGYGRAKRAAESVGRAERRDAWLFAREAASVIARGELGDGELTEQVLGVVADTAGALAIKDLIPPRDFVLLLTPWTWRGEPVTAAGATGATAAAVKPRRQGKSAKPSKVPPAGVPPARASASSPEAAGPPEKAIPATKPAARGRPDAPEIHVATDPPIQPQQPAKPAASPSAPAPSAPSAPPRIAPLLVQPQIRSSPRPVVPTTFHVGDVARVEEAAGPIRSAPPPGPEVGKAFGQTSVSEFGVSPWQQAADDPPAAPAVAGTPGSPRPRQAEPATRTTLRGPAVPANRDDRAAGVPIGAAGRSVSRLLSVAALIAAIAVVAILGALGPPREQQVAGVTDAPTALVTQEIPTHPETHGPTADPEPSSTDPGTGPTDPPARPTTGAAPPTAGAANPTPRPSAAPTPRPTPTPPPSPTPTPVAAPTPTPTPMPPQCTVPDLVGTQTSNAAPLWAAAGFTGPITFDPPVPPQFRIASQSLAPGSQVACTSGITVRAAP